MSKSELLQGLRNINCIKLYQISTMLRKPLEREAMLFEFIKMSVRMLIKETFEFMVEYTNRTSQTEKLKEQNWYNFAKILRNALSHNMRIEFKYKSYEKLLPVSFNGKIIDKNMAGSELTFDLFGLDDYTKLFLVIYEFAEKDLN
jgi:hypothetical protein